MLGATVADNLFGGEAGAVGRFVLVGGAPFEVAGVLTARGATPWGNDQDDVVLLPITTGMMRLFGQSYLSGITVAVGDTKRIDATEAAGTHVTMPASFDNAAPADRRSTPGSVQEAGQGGTSSAIRR